MEPNQGSKAERTLLIVEDDRDSGTAIAAIATRHGWTRRSVESCREARELLATPGFQCDVAVVDLQLSDGWGLDLVAALHAPPVLCAGVVVITGVAPSAELAASVYAHGASLLWKPRGVFSLAATLDAAYERTQALRRVVHSRPQQHQRELVSPMDRIFERAAERFLLDDDEVPIVRQICLERTDREIAAELRTSESALKRTLAVIRAKLGVETRSGIVRKIYEAALEEQAPVREVGSGAGRGG